MFILLYQLLYYEKVIAFPGSISPVIFLHGFRRKPFHPANGGDVGK